MTPCKYCRIRLEAPVTRMAVLLKRPFQPFHEIIATDLLRAQAGQMRRWQLAINQVKTPVFKLPHEMHKRHFGSIGFAAEHGFTEKDAAQGDAIKPADKFPVHEKRPRSSSESVG